MNLRSSVRQFLRMCGHAMTGTVHERLDTLERHARETEIHLNSLEAGQASLLQAAIHSVETLHAIARPNLLDTAQCPEGALLAFLYSYLPSRKGAAQGAKWRERLLANGFEIGLAEEEDVGLVCSEVDADFGDRVRGMRALGYAWHIVIYKSETGFSYFANQSAAPAGGCGGAFSFREYRVFAEALKWCSATLTATYFRPGTPK